MHLHEPQTCVIDVHKKSFGGYVVCVLLGVCIAGGVY